MLPHATSVTTGDAAKNLDLYKRCAESVKNALVNLSFSAGRLATQGFGQTKPVSMNDTPQGGSIAGTGFVPAAKRRITHP